MDTNVCRFVPRQPSHDQISILHFVLETTPQSADRIHRQAFHVLYYVLEGTGTLTAAGVSHALKPGDLFFTLPAVSWTLETQDMQYLYVSFLGARANAVLEQLSVIAVNCVFSGFEHLKSWWLSGLDVCQEMSGMRSESILLFSLSEIGKQRFEGEKTNQSAAVVIRKYIDEHFTDPALTLESVGHGCGYHPKYVSTVFAKAFQVGFAEYLNTIRIQQACALMEQGMACIKDIAGMCGYKDAMYFSRVFKKQMNVSPKEHCAELKQNQNSR